MKSRVISGTVLVVFLAAIVVFNQTIPIALNIAIALVCAMAVYEISFALGMAKKYPFLVPSLVFSAALPFVNSKIWELSLYYGYTVVIFCFLIFFHKHTTFREVGVIYSMTIMIPTALETLINLRSLGGEHGMFYVIIGIFSAWIADTGAFFTGTFLGKHKLCPDISPKKTIEGLMGGFVVNIAAMLTFGFVFSKVLYGGTVKVSYGALLFIGIFATVLSVIGDLSFSLIKRSCHIKDFGEVIPGHGGILDRFDSVIFVAPFVYFITQIFPIVIA